MTRFDAFLLHLSNGLVMATGLVYAWMAYFVKSEDEFAVVNHPWQPDVQHLHILAAPFLVFVLGHLWHRHAWPHFDNGTRPGRRSGIGMVAMALPMIASGYLIQVAVEPVWRNAWVVTHCATAALWILGYVAHFARHRLRAAA